MQERQRPLDYTCSDLSTAPENVSRSAVPIQFAPKKHFHEHLAAVCDGRETSGSTPSRLSWVAAVAGSGSLMENTAAHRLRLQAKHRLAAGRGEHLGPDSGRSSGTPRDGRRPGHRAPRLLTSCSARITESSLMLGTGWMG